MHRAGPAVAIVLEVEGAFNSREEAGLFVTARGEEFVVTTHLRFECLMKVCVCSGLGEWFEI